MDGPLIDFGKLTGSSTQVGEYEAIQKQETVLNQSPNAEAGRDEINRRMKEDNVEWLKMALEANRRVNSSQPVSPDDTIESSQAMELARQLGDQMIENAKLRYTSANQLLAEGNVIVSPSSK